MNIPLSVKLKRGWQLLSLEAIYFMKRSQQYLTGTTPLGELDVLYKQMSSDSEKAGQLYRSSVQWERINREFRRHMYNTGIDNFKSGYYNTRFAAPEPQRPQIYSGLLWVYYNQLKKRDSLKLLDRIEEPKYGGEGYCVTIENKRISLDLLQSIDEFYCIYEALNHENKDHYIIAELGAGYGRLSYIFLEAMPNVTYVTFDLPESLLISQNYLTTIFSNQPTLKYEESRKLDTINRSNLMKYKLAFMLPHQLENVVKDTFDVFTNIYSMQEMKPQQIENYFKIIDKTCSGVFSLKQHYKENNRWDKVVIDKETYPIRSNWKQLFTRTSTLYQHVFESLYRV